MLRRSTCRLVVPFSHPVVPGRPSERGYLYRSAHQNAYNRLALPADYQKTDEEHRMKQFVVAPEPYICFQLVLALTFGLHVYMFVGRPLGANSSSWFRDGGSNEEELFQRNKDMQGVFASHQDYINQLREKAGAKRPAVYAAPQDGLSWREE